MLPNGCLSMSFPIPQNEAERLKALRDLKILDGNCVPGFDALCEIARDHFRVPIAFVSFIDSDDQVLKDRCGIGASGTPCDIFDAITIAPLRYPVQVISVAMDYLWPPEHCG